MIPENYPTVLGVLKGNAKAIRKQLYAELRRIPRAGWGLDVDNTIESLDRVPRQLKASGEKLEHLGIKMEIESKLPQWMLHQKQEQEEIWSVESCVRQNSPKAKGKGESYLGRNPGEIRPSSKERNGH